MDLKQSFSRSSDYKVYPYCCPIKLYLGHVTERKKSIISDLAILRYILAFLFFILSIER